MNDICAHLRNAVQELRRKPIPLADMIPAMNAAADEIERLRQRENDLLKHLALKRGTPQTEAALGALGVPR